MAAQAQRIADLERQLGELRAEFEALAAAAEHFFEAGRAYERTPRSAASPAWRPRPSHLRLVSGGGQ